MSLGYSLAEQAEHEHRTALTSTRPGPHKRDLPLNLPLSLIFPSAGSSPPPPPPFFFRQLAAVSGRIPSSDVTEAVLLYPQVIWVWRFSQERSDVPK